MAAMLIVTPTSFRAARFASNAQSTSSISSAVAAGMSSMSDRNDSSVISEWGIGIRIGPGRRDAQTARALTGALLRDPRLNPSERRIAVGNLDQDRDPSNHEIEQHRRESAQYSQGRSNRGDHQPARNERVSF
jgi:hypothetical protein